MKTMFDAVDQMQSALTFHRERQSVLAGNVANVDTPGYRPLDLERLDPGAPGTMALATTNERHLDSGGLPDTTVSFADGEASGADGNGVNLERELAKIDANRLRYTTTAELASRRLALLRYTAGDGT